MNVKGERARLKYLSGDVEPEMGDTYARMTVHGPSGSATVDAIVDTGATFTKISRRTARKSGFSGRRQVEVVLANGEKAVRELGSIGLEIESQRDVVPVTVGDEGEAELVGCTALEILGFKVNPITRKLEPNPPIEY
jgi:predicted aspartyl protease